VQVTTRYPGASAKTVIDTVALPIEQQVNGVEDMLYMQSYSAADGSYSLTVTFKIGTDLNFAQVLVQNRVSSALSQAAAIGAEPGRHRAEEIDGDPAVRDADVAESDLRQPVPEQLRHHQYPRRAVAPARRRQRHGVRRRPVFDAGLARSEQAVCARADAAGRHPGDPAAEPAGHRGPGRRAAGAGRAGVPIYAERQRRLDDTSQFENVIVKTGRSGDVTRVRDVGWVELGAQTYSQIFPSTTSRPPASACSSRPAPTRWRSSRPSKKKMEALAQGVSTGRVIRHAVRHHEIRLGIDQRGLQDADRGRSARAGRDPDLSAGLARDAGAGDHVP
jgi:HAE1 family hydrophobic/amphiphilic exporter-1